MGVIEGRGREELGSEKKDYMQYLKINELK
jgi:hypothetical protein